MGGISSVLQTNTTQKEDNILSPSRCSVTVDGKPWAHCSTWLISHSHTHLQQERENHLLPSLCYTRVFTCRHTNTQTHLQTLFLFLASACGQGEAEINPRYAYNVLMNPTPHHLLPVRLKSRFSYRSSRWHTLVPSSYFSPQSTCGWGRGG